MIPNDSIETAFETRVEAAIVVGQSDKNWHEPILRFEGLHLARTSNCQPKRKRKLFSHFWHFPNFTVKTLPEWSGHKRFLMLEAELRD